MASERCARVDPTPLILLRFGALPRPNPWYYLFSRNQPMIYSPASSIDDRTRVWVGRLPDHDNEMVISSQTPPSCGSPAWFVSARESARAEQVPDIIGTDGIVWARSCQGSLTAAAHQARWMR